MTRRLLIIFIAIGLATHVSGCSSGGSKENSDVAVSNDETFAEEGQGDFADEGGGNASGDELDAGDKAAPEAEALAGNGDAAPAPEGKLKEETAPEGGEDLALDEDPGKGLDDELALDEGGDTAPPATAKNNELNKADPNTVAPKQETAKTEPPPTDEPLFGGEPANEAPPPPPIADNSEPPAPPVDNGSGPSIEPPAAEPPPPPAVASSFAPLQKVKDVPFEKNGTLLNRVYVARPGDTSKSVAEKIYGKKSRSKDLVKWNSILASRDMKTGDKIYYSSPSNPTDSARILTFYEDNNIPPSVYTSKEGDNIRKVSKNLLGSSESWKEIWATNPNIESKGDLPGGTEIRYWPSDVSVPSLASTTMPSAPSAPDTQPMHDPAFPNQSEPGMGAAGAQAQPPTAPPEQAPPPPMDVAQAPPPPAPPSTGTVEQPPPPPPEDPLAPPPPVEQPPPPPKAQKVEAAAAEAAGTDTETLITMAFGGILFVTAAILLVVVRRNRMKKQQSMMGLGGPGDINGDLGQTQV